MLNSSYEQGLRYSLRLLKTRMYSERILAQKIEQRGVEPDVCQEIIDYLRSHHLLDDRAYADSLIRSAARYRSASTRMIKYKLQQKGIDRTVIEERIIKQSDAIPSEKERALDLANKWQIRHGARTSENSQRDRLGAFLHRKGFNFNVIREIINSVDE